MRGKRIFLIGLALLTTMGIGSWGCGSSPVVSPTTSTGSGGSSGGSGGSTGGETTMSGVLTIDNSATSSSVQSQSLKSLTTASGYSILATDVSSGAGTRAATSSAGAYSLSLTQDTSYVFVIFDASNRLSAVITGRDTVGVSGIITQSTRYVVSAFKPVDKVASANIVLNETKGNAWWAGKDADLKANFKIELDTDIVAVANDVGGATGNGDNLGAGLETAKPSGATGNSIDSDLDGIPDELDADRDGDGTLDALEAPASGESSNFGEVKAPASLINHAASAATLYRPYAQMNASTLDNAKDDALNLELYVYPKTGKDTSIKSVIVSAGPSYISSLDFRFEPEGLLETYPGNGVLWQTTGYKLFHRSNSFASSSGVATYWSGVFTVDPALLKPGDAFTFKVTYSDDTVEEITRIIGFTFSSTVQLDSYQTAGISHTAPTPAAGGEGTVANPIRVTAGQPIILTFTRPKDNTNAEMNGLSYRATIFEQDGSKNPLKTLFVTDIKDPGGQTISLPAFTPDVTVTSGGTAKTVTYLSVSLVATTPNSNDSAVLLLEMQTE